MVHVPAESDRQPIIVVGNGMVGHHFCESLHKTAPNRKHVLILGKETIAAYDRVNLGRSITEPDSALGLSEPGWYEACGYELRLGMEVTKIEPRDRKVVCSSGEVFTYSALILATGSHPWKPPVDGIDTDGLLFFRDMEDVERIREKAQPGSKFAVIGGGLLGLESARALLDLGVHVDVLEIADHLMPRQLDRKGGELLAALLTEQGMAIKTGFQASEIRKAGPRYEIHGNGGEVLDVDGIVVSVGIRPTTSFLEGTPIERTQLGHIVVDEQCQTSVNGIFAIGECVSIEGQTYGFVSPGYQMAEVLADRLAGGTRRFEPPAANIRLKTSGIDVAVLGDHLQADPRSQSMAWSSTASEDRGYRKVITDSKGHLTGAISVGSWGSFPSLAEDIEEARRIRKRQRERFTKSGELDELPEGPAVLGWADSTKICNCMSVDKGRICAAIADGADSIQAIGAATFAGTVCGSCHPILSDLLRPDATYKPKVPLSAWMVLGASLLCIIFVSVTLWAKPLLYAISVESYWYRVDQLWRDGFLKQFTGYSLFALCLLAMWLPLQKHFKAMKRGNYAMWRAIHTLTGVLSLLILFLHTGFHFGDNLNAWLFFVFALLNLFGGVAGVFAGMEAKGSVFFRKFRPAMTWIHLLFFWPIPLLVLVHIFSVYYW